MKRQWVRLQRRAFAMQAPPIHSSIAVQMTPRACGSRNNAATMAPAGRTQSKAKLRQLPAQSRAPDWVQALRLSGSASSATARRGATARACFLDRGARHVAVRAEYAAVALERPQHLAAMTAVVEVLAGVGRHRFA